MFKVFSFVGVVLVDECIGHHNSHRPKEKCGIENKKISIFTLTIRGFGGRAGVPRGCRCVTVVATQQRTRWLTRSSALSFLLATFCLKDLRLFFLVSSGTRPI